MQPVDTWVESYAYPLPSEVKHNAAKRLFDLFFSSAMLLLLLPILILIAFLILVTSPGKIIYGHRRIGRGGKPFYCYKFRTMYSDSSERLRELLEKNPEKRVEWESTFKLKDDPRVTPVGRFLRRTSLDELPQFWNVLMGDLSVVGPRPVVEEELAIHFKDKAEKILTIRPGVTGLWQVSGRSDTSYALRVSLDELYVDSGSLWMDLSLIFKTIKCVVIGKGAY